MRTTRLSALILLLSLSLGPSARAGSDIKSDEEVVFFTTAASYQDGEWVAPIHGWIFEPEEGSFKRGLLAESLRGALHVKASQEATFRRRLAWFLVDNESRKKITVTAGGTTTRLSKSGSNGHFRGTLRLKERSYRESATVLAETRKGDHRRFAGKVLLVPDEGISVISDIDDTIKVTGSWDRKRTLENTFLSSFSAVPDMATLYRRWKREGAVFHYVSAGPWQLFVPLRDFMKRVAFPEGTMHLQDLRVWDASRFNLLKSPHEYKVKTIEALLEQFPRRRFVLVGDAGQDDPEIYAEIARNHPRQIRSIYIRRIGPRGMSAQRLRSVQAGLEIPVQVFEKPVDLTL